MRHINYCMSFSLLALLCQCRSAAEIPADPSQKVADPETKPGEPSHVPGGVQSPETRALLAWPTINFVDNPGGTDPKAVALTFDDGPDGGVNNTGYILDQLRALKLHGTFYVCSKVWTDLASDPVAQDDIRRILAEGHEIGNHTAAHHDLGEMTPAEAQAAFAIDADAVKHVPGLDPQFVMSQYRAPYGSPFQDKSPAVGPIAAAVAGFGVHVGWGIDSDDWRCAEEKKDTKCILDTLAKQLDEGHSGPILMHAVYRLTGDALPAVVQMILAKGYRIVSVEELIRAKYGHSSLEVMRAHEAAQYSPDEVSKAAVEEVKKNTFDHFQF